LRGGSELCSNLWMGRADLLKPWVLEALKDLGGTGSVVSVSRVVWNRHEEDLRQFGDLFFTWQYDIRWAAQKLRDEGLLVKMDGLRNADWRLASSAPAADEADEWLTDEADDGFV